MILHLICFQVLCTKHVNLEMKGARILPDKIGFPLLLVQYYCQWSNAIGLEQGSLNRVPEEPFPLFIDFLILPCIPRHNATFPVDCRCDVKPMPSNICKSDYLSFSELSKNNLYNWVFGNASAFLQNYSLVLMGQYRSHQIVGYAFWNETQLCKSPNFSL